MSNLEQLCPYRPLLTFLTYSYQNNILRWYSYHSKNVEIFKIQFLKTFRSVWEWVLSYFCRISDSRSASQLSTLNIKQFVYSPRLINTSFLEFGNQKSLQGDSFVVREPLKNKNIISKNSTKQCTHTHTHIYIYIYIYIYFLRYALCRGVLSVKNFVKNFFVLDFFKSSKPAWYSPYTIFITKNFFPAQKYDRKLEPIDNLRYVSLHFKIKLVIKHILKFSDVRFGILGYLFLFIWPLAKVKNKRVYLEKKGCRRLVSGFFL